MMKLRKIWALVLAVAMIALVGAAFATAAELAENSEEGVAGNWNAPDTERVQGDSVNIKKEIIAFNPNDTTVHAPVITYTYTVTPASVSELTVTDETGDHESGAAVTAPVNAGITTGLVVTGANAAGAAVAGSTGTASSASATLVFDNTSTWTTAADGDSNEYDIGLDFSGVAFPHAGVYRYQIAETISAASYAVVAMEDGANDTLYLDVYVDGSGDIYGYVCMTTNASVTPDTATKVNGFVEGTSIDNADKYYTYDLVLSKDVQNDSYAESTVAFPFTVIFNNTESYTSTFTITETAASGSTGISPTAASAPTWSGVALVKDGANITYTGIPAGVDVDVYETNIVDGTTYAVTSNVNGTAAEEDDAVISGTAPTTAVAQTTKADYQSTKVTVDTTGITVVDDEQTVEIINSLLLISPTGYVARFAPYALMLIGGIALLIVAKKHRRHAEEDEK